MGKVKNMAWDQATEFLGNVENKLLDGEMTKETALSKLKNFKGNLALEGISDEYQAEEWVDLVIADRVNQVENEGNDPLETGESFGTPHDLASLYSTKRDKSVTDTPEGYDEDDPGRPKSKLSKYKSEQDPFGKDPLGQDSMKEPESLRLSDTNDVRTFQENQLARHKNVLDSLKKKRPSLLTEDEGLLNENNISGLG